MDDQYFYGLIDANYTSAYSIKQYKGRLTKLKEICKKNILDIIKTPLASYKEIQAYYPNVSSRKSVLTVILVLFKHSPELQETHQAQQKEWMKHHDNLNGFQEAQLAKNQPTLKQLSTYTSFEEIDLKYKELKKDDPHSTLLDSQYFLFLSICLAFPPKRADYWGMKIYYNKDPNIRGENYVVLHPSTPSYFVFTRFKTDKTYMRVDETIPKPLFKDIQDSLRRHPRDYLFVNRLGKPYGDSNAFRKFVARAFETLFGKTTGVTMLRHVYITEKVDLNQTTEDLNNIARQMMHSTSLQRKYHWNKDAMCKTMEHICKS